MEANRPVDLESAAIGSSGTNNALHEAEARYQRLYQNMFDAIIVYDYKNEKVLDCNASAIKLLGYSQAEILQLNRFDVMPAKSKFFPGVDIHAVIRKTHRAMVYKGETISSLGEVISKEGKRISAKVNVVPIYKESYYGFVIVHDISKEVEQQMEMNRMFNQQKQILDSIPAPFIFKDLNNNILACNKAMANMLGGSHPRDIVGANLSSWINADKAAEFYKEDAEIINRGQSQVRTIHSFKDKHGNKRWNRSDKTPFLDENGAITGILSYDVDITELMEKNERLKQYIESNKQLENFAAIASHDLQAPLRTINGYTQLLNQRLKGRLTEDEQEFMQFVISATSNMRHLIRDLRTYSQVDSAKLNLKHFSMDGLVKEVLGELKATIDYTKANVQFQDKMPIIRGDRIKKRQLIQNLVTNALKYIAEGVIPKIELNFEDQDQYWYFEVKDNGIGIDESYQERIFELFKRLHTNTTYQGTGIGLSLCKKVVDQHQGTIGVHSIVGKGSTFYFTIAKKVETVEDLMS